MSDFSEYKDRLDMREQLVRIDRSLIETQKLAAEASNLRVTRFVTPVAAVVAALGTLTAAAPVLMRWWQGHS